MQLEEEPEVQLGVVREVQPEVVPDMKLEDKKWILLEVITGSYGRKSYDGQLTGICF